MGCSEQRCRPVRPADDGWRLWGNRQHYCIQCSNIPALGAWIEVCLKQNPAGMICRCRGGALLARFFRTTLRTIFLTEGVRRR
jgi:hypothetical protein